MFYSEYIYYLPIIYISTLVGSMVYDCFNVCYRKDIIKKKD